MWSDGGILHLLHFQSMICVYCSFSQLYSRVIVIFFFLLDQTEKSECVDACRSFLHFYLQNNICLKERMSLNKISPKIPLDILPTLF